MMPRSLSRWLAPLALLASLLAVLIVVSGSTKDEDGGSGSNPTTEERSEAQGGQTGTQRTSTSGRTTSSSPRKSYKVRPGDTLALIAERTGVTVEELQDLNPEIDANSLTVGQKIKLTE
jgi:teichoic acid transport system ATP-binding protein